MFGRSIHLFSLFGFEVRINVSWTFLAVLIAVSLALGFFPATYEGLPAITYWWMAALGVVGVFFSIVFHELSHSLAARTMGMEMKGITLFLFGGVAHMDREPASARAELIMAIAGPLFSLALAGLLFWIAPFFREADQLTPFGTVLEYLGWLNLVLAIFNMIPAFPLDGGRVLRAILWAIRGNLRWATKWASRGGAAFGILLSAGGIAIAITGALVQGLWWFLIGMFIRAAAMQSYQQLEIERLMRGVTAGDVMRDCPHAVPRDMTISDLVERYVYEFQQTEFPVCENGELVGVIGVSQIRHVPKEDWGGTRVADIMVPPDRAEVIEPSEDAVDALRKLQSSGADALVIARNGRPAGILSQRDVLKLLNLKMDLEST